MASAWNRRPGGAAFFTRWPRFPEPQRTEPDGPRMTTNSPGQTSSSTSRNASTATAPLPYRLRQPCNATAGISERAASSATAVNSTAPRRRCVKLRTLPPGPTRSCAQSDESQAEPTEANLPGPAARCDLRAQGCQASGLRRCSPCACTRSSRRGIMRATTNYSRYDSRNFSPRGFDVGGLVSAVWRRRQIQAAWPVVTSLVLAPVGRPPPAVFGTTGPGAVLGRRALWRR